MTDNYLVNFKVANYRSFCQETVFSMQAAPNKEFSELNTFRTNEKLLHRGESELLKAAVIFGANASGKSNLIKALRFMRAVVLSSAVQGAPIVNFVEPFAFLDYKSDEPSAFELDFVAGGVFYNYGFEVRNGKIIKEYLNKRRERLSPVFKRDGSSITLSNTNTNLSALLNIKDHTLFLSFATNLKFLPDDFNDIIEWFTNLTIVTETDRNGFDVYLENPEYLEIAADFLARADFGIDKFRVIKDKIGEINERGINSGIIESIAPPQIKAEKSDIFCLDLETQFNVFDGTGEKVGTKKVQMLKDFGFNSNGTYRLMCFLGLLIRNLDKGGVIVIDEIDSQIHFLIVAELIKRYNSISFNPKNAQLICTAHSVLLMDEELRRDQIYFTMKAEHGQTSLYSLSDFNGVKKTDLFSQKYLAGFYSAIPSKV